MERHRTNPKSLSVNISPGDEILIHHLCLKSTITLGRQIETGLQMIISSNGTESHVAIPLSLKVICFQILARTARIPSQLISNSV